LLTSNVHYKRKELVMASPEMDTQTSPPKDDPPTRRLWVRMFLGDTLEQIEQQMASYLGHECICPGNYIDVKLWKLGDVYQAALVHAIVIQPGSFQLELKIPAEVGDGSP
jgi:hypothetical protein